MRNLLIILLISVIVFSITLMSNTKNIDFIKKRLNTNNQILENLNNAIHSAIKKQVLLFRDYQEYLDDADTIRQLNSKIKTANQPNFQVFYHQIQQVNAYHAEEIKSLLQYIDTTHYQPTFLKKELFNSQLHFNEIAVLNFIAEKCKGTCIDGFWLSLYDYETKNYCCLGDGFEGKYFLASLRTCGKRAEDFIITVNGKPIKLKDYKGKFQLKPTSTGKQTYKVTLEVMNRKGKLEKYERIFEYWVSE
ncbi:MAG: hypothetical protein AB8G11_23255 [Saprospiraceae bacterium]